MAGIGDLSWYGSDVYGDLLNESSVGWTHGLVSYLNTGSMASYPYNEVVYDNWEIEALDQAVANIDWLLDTAFDAGMTFAHIGVYNYLRTPLNVTKHPERMNIVEETLDAGKTRQLIKELDPDIILSAYASGNSDDHAVIDVLPMVPDLGVMSAVLIMERWIRLMQTKRKGEWERDRVLFEKYFR